MVGTSFESFEKKSNSKQDFEDEIKGAKSLTNGNASTDIEKKVCK